MNNAKTFEEYMSYVHMEENPMVLDDDLADSFDSWLEGLSPYDVLFYAKRYAPLQANTNTHAYCKIMEIGV